MSTQHSYTFLRKRLSDSSPANLIVIMGMVEIAQALRSPKKSNRQSSSPWSFPRQLVQVQCGMMVFGKALRDQQSQASHHPWARAPVVWPRPIARHDVEVRLAKALGNRRASFHQIRGWVKSICPNPVTRHKKGLAMWWTNQSSRSHLLWTINRSTRLRFKKRHKPRNPPQVVYILETRILRRS